MVEVKSKVKSGADIIRAYVKETEVGTEFPSLFLIKTFSDLSASAVTSAVSNLVKAGVLVDTGKKTKPGITGKAGAIYAIAKHEGLEPVGKPPRKWRTPMEKLLDEQEVTTARIRREAARLAKTNGKTHGKTKRPPLSSYTKQELSAEIQRRWK